jgi:hypothetical protein
MEQVLPHTKKNGELRAIIDEYNKEHEVLGRRRRELLSGKDSETKRPGAFVRAMTYAESAMMLRFKDTEETVAKLMHKGCAMGIRTLSQRMNEYKGADDESRRLAEDIIKVEDSFEKDLRRFL